MRRITISKELLQRWNDRIAWVQSSVFNAHESEEDKAKRIKRARKDYRFFIKTYFPTLAEKETAKFQAETAEIIKLSKNIKMLLEWARGHAKSTHVCLFIPLWLHFQETNEINFMVLVSKNETAAIRLLSDLQFELQYNEALIRDFGKQVMEGNWTDGEFTATNGTTFYALGRGQSPRGLKYRGRRPDYIVIDDIDDDEMVRNPKRVGEALEWILTALFGTTAGGRGRIVMVGNRIAKDSILSRFAELKGVVHTKVNMLNKKGLPSWPENYTMKEIESIRDFIGERRFQKEYMNNPITEGSVFKQKDIKYGKVLDLKFYRTLISYTDPSFKDSATADYKATALLGKTPNGEFHLIKMFVDQTSVYNMVQWHYDIDKYINARVPILYYMESNFLQDLLLDEFRKVGNMLGHQIPVRGDNRKKPDKFARIEAMQPIFERGLFMINEDEKESQGVQKFVEQLLMFEKGSRSHDDAPDAVEGAISILSARSRSSTASFASGARVNHKY